MISATQLRPTPPLWPTIGSLWISGWVAGLAVLALSPQRFVNSGLAPSLVYLSAAGALLGALALRALLPRLDGVAISYPWAVVAIGIGTVIGNAFALAVQAVAFRSTPSVVPEIWSSPLATLGATLLSLFVSYRVVAATCRDVGGRRPAPRPVSSAGEPESAYPSGLEGDAARAQATVARTCVELSRCPANEIPGVVLDVLTELGRRSQALRRAAPDDPLVHAAVTQFADGLDRFETALAEIASAAARTGSQRMVQPGLFRSSLSDVSDGGALARYELDHADGLADIREACERLRALGVLPAG